METKAKNLLIYLILPLVLLIVAVLVAAQQARPDFKLHVNFYDNATLIKTYQGRKIVIDGGVNDQILVQLGNNLPFYDHTIDLIVLTKPDSAHVSGLVNILKRYKVKKVLIPPSDATAAAYWEFLKLVEQNHVKKVFSMAGQRIWLDQSTVLDISSTDPFAAQLSFGKTQISIPDLQDKNVELISDGINVDKKQFFR